MLSRKLPLERERRKLLEPLEEFEEKKRRAEVLAKNPLFPALGIKATSAIEANRISALAGFASAMMILENRTPEQFRAQVETYLDRQRETVKRTAALTVSKADMCDLRLEIQNLTTDNLEGVRLELYFTIDGFVFSDTYHEKFNILKPPQQWGPRMSDMMPLTIRPFHTPVIEDIYPEVSRDKEVTKIVFPSVRLRSEREARVDPLAFVSFSDAETITAHWKATNVTFGHEYSGDIELRLGRVESLQGALNTEIK